VWVCSFPRSGKFSIYDILFAFWQTIVEMVHLFIYKTVKF
jgi:hypothetical protein